MSAPAWQVRGYQRQRFLENMNRGALRYREDDIDAFLFDVNACILNFLAQRRKGIEIPALPNFPIDSDAKDFFATEVIDATTVFARSIEERDLLLATALEKYFTPGCMYYFHRLLSSQEMVDLQR
jgi:hypothetical protein